MTSLRLFPLFLSALLLVSALAALAGQGLLAGDLAGTVALLTAGSFLPGLLLDYGRNSSLASRVRLGQLPGGDPSRQPTLPLRRAA